MRERHDLRRYPKTALAWPEVEDGTSYGTPALKVRKKLLARLKEDGDSLVMPGVPLDERDMLVESQPKLFYFTDHYRDYPMVLIRLSKAKRAIVEPLLRRRWRDAGVKGGGAGIRCRVRTAQDPGSRHAIRHRLARAMAPWTKPIPRHGAAQSGQSNASPTNY